MQSCCILRRAYEGDSLLLTLMKTSLILLASSDSLTQLLRMHGLQLRKNSTKSAKIRALMKLESITKHCNEQILAKIEAALQANDEKRRKNQKGTTTEAADEDEEIDEATRLHSLTYHHQFLEEFPNLLVTSACLYENFGLETSSD